MQSDSALGLLMADHARLGVQAHVGVLVPWANVIVETELPRLGLDRVVFHYARLVPARRCRSSEEFLREIADAVPDVLEQLARLPLAGTLLGCTSVGFTVPAPLASSVVGAFESILSALARLRARRVVLATPYPAEWTEREAEALAAEGVIVLDRVCMGLGLFDEYAGIGPGQICRLVHRVEPGTLGAADALVLSCTAWPTLGLIAEFERTLGIPVVSSNLAMGLQAVQMASIGESSWRL